MSDKECVDDNDYTPSMITDTMLCADSPGKDSCSGELPVLYLDVVQFSKNIFSKNSKNSNRFFEKNRKKSKKIEK
jgi:hypothetical protein